MHIEQYTFGVSCKDFYLKEDMSINHYLQWEMKIHTAFFKNFLFSDSFLLGNVQTIKPLMSIILSGQNLKES